MTERGTPWRKTIRGIVFNTALKVALFDLPDLPLLTRPFFFFFGDGKGNPLFYSTGRGQRKRRRSGGGVVIVLAFLRSKSYP